MPCSVCKQPGHNMRTCINMPWPPIDPTRNLLHTWRLPVWRMRTTTTTTTTEPPSPSITPTILYSERLISPSELLLTPLPLTPLPLTTLPLTTLPLTPRRRRREMPSDDITLTLSDDTTLTPSAIRRWIFEPQWRRESENQQDILLDNPSLQRVNIIMELVDCVDKPCHIDECPICMESINLVDTFTTRCGHMFHGTCMLIHTQTKKTCPMCRGTLIK